MTEASTYARLPLRLGRVLVVWLVVVGSPGLLGIGLADILVRWGLFHLTTANVVALLFFPPVLSLAVACIAGQGFRKYAVLLALVSFVAGCITYFADIIVPSVTS
jgi:hypothetical protein